MTPTNLPERPATTLGGGYTLERELGGGGMSRVFVAREEALGRRVVVKVLAPALVEGLSAERFAREVRLAAALQEPHIVPVLAAGTTADGLPFYTMPYVEGESLRARLQRGPVPLDEAVAVLRDVLRALGYAHARAVVHRDVKPENVLLSSGTAVVTDFGIAKALQASRTATPDGPADATVLTQLGMAIGTPAYIAPEQAAGDPTTDHRADLYAWGMMAYELLAGRHPFAGKTSPQQLIAAHLSETPLPLGAAGSAGHDVPPALAALVMRCLEKEPARRPVGAAAVLAALEAARDEGVRAAALRDAPIATPRILGRALALYAAALVAVTLTAWTATNALGLPDWVVPGALLVMALGLPVLLATGLVHHQSRHKAPRGAAGAPLSVTGTFAARARPHLTWRRVVWGGAVTLGAFVVIVIGYMTLRALGIGPAGSLLAAGVINEREPLLVADFYVAGPDTALGPVVAEAVRTQLGQSKAITVVPASQLDAALRRMQRTAGTRLDAALAREVAQREGVRAIVGGELTPLGGGYLVTLRLVTAATGDVVAAFQKTAETPATLIPTLDGLTRELRGRIGESLKAVRDDPPLEQVTTASLAALRKYTAAVQAGRVGERAEGATLAREAIALDTTFASAYRVLGNLLSTLNPVGRDSAFATAYRFRDRLGERERLLTIANYFMSGPERDRRRAVAAYDALLERDSADATALNNLGGILVTLREFGRAEQLLRRAAAVRPGYPSLANLVYSQAGQGRFAAADSSAALLLVRFPQASGAPELGVNVSAAALQFDSAAARVERWQATIRDPAARVSASDWAADFAIVRGRLAEAARFDVDLRNAWLAQGETPRPLYSALRAAKADLWLRGDPVRATQRLDAALAAHPVASIGAAEGRADLLAAAAVYAAAERPAPARALLAEFAGVANATEQQLAAPQREEALAEIALVEGRAEEAIAAFRRSDIAADGGPSSWCAVCVLPGMARAAERAGWADSARIWWERFATEPAINRVNTDVPFLVIAYRRLGELYADAGDRATAAKYYGLFLELFQNADADLQPQVAAVRAELARLAPDAPRALPVPKP